MVTDWVQGKGIGPSCWQDNDISGSLIQREVCHPGVPGLRCAQHCGRTQSPALCLLHCPQHTSSASWPLMAAPTVAITSAFQQQEGGTRPYPESTYISFSYFH